MSQSVRMTRRKERKSRMVTLDRGQRRILMKRMMGMTVTLRMWVMRWKEKGKKASQRDR